MRGSPGSYVALSVAIHGALVAWLATSGIDSKPEPRESAATPAPAAAVPPIPEAVVEVLLLEDGARVVEEGIVPAKRSRIAASRRAEPVARHKLRKGPDPLSQVMASAVRVPSPDSRAPSSLMSMGPRGVRLELPAGRWDVPATATAPGPARAKPEPEPDLDPSTAPLGAAAARGYTSRTFSMTVAHDGSAKLRDGRNLVVHLPTRKALGDLIQAWAESPKGSADPYAHEEDFSRPLLAPVGSIGATIATFDVSDWLMREAGQDPYASQKLKVLDATRDERVQIGATHRHEQLARATELMQANVDELWATSQDPTERKRGAFELWDECAETGTADLLEAGLSARALVIGVIRARLPVGSPDAFTPDELARFNAHKQSHAPFVPYE